MKKLNTNQPKYPLYLVDLSHVFSLPQEGFKHSQTFYDFFQMCLK